MKLVKSKKANLNYLAKVVDIKEFSPHPNPEVTKLKCAHVDGFNIIVGIDEPEGKYIYFPTSSEINPNLLSYANLYRHTDKNVNHEKSGFFEDNGRVKAIKLKGLVSEGFLLPFMIFENFIVDSTNVQLDKPETNLEFDSVSDGNKEFWVCKKYIVKTHQHFGGGQGKTRQPKGISKIIENQFRFHYETAQYKKNPYFIKPDDYIHISGKIHGTSHISSYVLCKFKRSFAQRALLSIYNLFSKDKVDTRFRNEYDYLYSSRTVVKNAYETKDAGGYYNCDVWKEADNILRPLLKKGMTIYAEIVGYLPNGGYIQKNYDYGCVPPENDEYISEKNFKVRPYRITVTNVDGCVHEFSPREVQIWCLNNGLTPVEEYYYGKAKDLYPDLDATLPNWNELFIERLSNDKNFYMELSSPDCDNKVPHEGIVLKIDNMVPAAVKLKSFAFLSGEQKELDAGVENIEDIA